MNANVTIKILNDDYAITRNVCNCSWKKKKLADAHGPQHNLYESFVIFDYPSISYVRTLHNSSGVHCASGLELSFFTKTL